MNNVSKVRTSMTPVNKEMADKVMTEVATPTASTNPMRTSAQLAEKLKKLMQSMDTNGNKEDTMEIDEEEQCKRTRAAQSPNSPSAAESPEIKKLRNDKTPTPHAKTKALFTTPSTRTSKTDNQHNCNASNIIIKGNSFPACQEGSTREHCSNNDSGAGIGYN